MNFVDKLLSLLKDGFDKLIAMLYAIVNFFAKPMAYLLQFLEGIFHFIVKLFEVVVQLIMIFVALFQFLFSIIAGVFRTIKMWLTVQPVSDVSFPSMSNRGFAVVIDLLQPTGLMTVVPMVALAFLWFFFIIKIIGLFGGQVMITPFGRGGSQ